MAERDQVAQVQMVLAGYRSEPVHCRRGIFERARPPTSRVSDTPVLNIPRRNTRLPQRFAEVSDIGECAASSPKAAVDNDRDRPVFRNGGNAEIAKLFRFGAVGYSPIRGRRFPVENIAAHVAMVRCTAATAAVEQIKVAENKGEFAKATAKVQRRTLAHSPWRAITLT
jgi:hypothetical protein